MTLATWLTFMLAAWAISFSPGAGALSAMTSGLRYGFARGYWNTAGLILGIMFQLAVVGIGLGTLLATSETAFAIVKYVGVGYLIYLGWRQFRAEQAPVTVDGAANVLESRRSLILRGFLINASNPKGTVFLLAVVPQFIDATHPLAGQYAAIAATMALTDTVAMAFYTLLAAKVLRLMRDPVHIKWMNRAFGTLFMVAGVLLALFRRSH
ncbi:LysE family transporter [Bordetella flabilis]|uniref:Threonine transporter RhtB n=1 Tax=Bordetella flabilis TaxID=463014 RepID=A0A193G7L7_9BORD|nr:LysE family transporter [Bordetella flabilis]ANN75815.1 threonine transporter RhtB [Bordetella flabilis]